MDLHSPFLWHPFRWGHIIVSNSIHHIRINCYLFSQLIWHIISTTAGFELWAIQRHSVFEHWAAMLPLDHNGLMRPANYLYRWLKPGRFLFINAENSVPVKKSDFRVLKMHPQNKEVCFPRQNKNPYYVTRFWVRKVFIRPVLNQFSCLLNSKEGFLKKEI